MENIQKSLEKIFDTRKTLLEFFCAEKSKNKIFLASRKILFF
jgi:hypothetical protein